MEDLEGPLASSLVDRVAMAMWTRNRQDAEQNNIRLDAWEDETEALRGFWRAIARAAIEAMREPTEEMIDAGITADRGKTLGDRIANTYEAMIEAALSKQA